MLTELISPPILKKGDTVGLIAPARKVDASEINHAIRMLESWGLRVLLGDNLYGSENQFSGSDAERAADLQAMIRNHEVKAILCARGGYGSVRVLDHINFRELQREPKWIVGYSDITVFHSILSSWYMVETIHATMPINFPADEQPNQSTESLRNVLFGNSPSYRIASHPFNRLGKAEGLLCGGNLSILNSLSGTDADLTTEGKILFIEDLDEYLYHIDRMMMNLKRSGKLRNIVGLVVGYMTGMNDNTVSFGKNALEIIRDTVDEYDYPVCFNFNAGHSEPNLALIFGRKVEMTIDSESVMLSFSPASCKLM